MDSLSWETLRTRSSASRTTLQRNLDALESKGWIETSPPRKYSLTLGGRCIADRFAELVETVKATETLSPNLHCFLADEFDFDIRLIADADVVNANEPRPYAPIDRQISLMEATDSFRWLLSTVGLQSMRVVHSCVINHHERHEIVIDPTVVDMFRSNSRYMDLVEDLLSSDTCSVFVAEKTVPFYLGISESRAQIGVHSDNGLLRSLVDCEQDDFREWSISTFATYKEHATRLDSTPVASSD